MVDKNNCSSDEKEEVTDFDNLLKSRALNREERRRWSRVKKDKTDKTKWYSPVFKKKR